MGAGLALAALTAPAAAANFYVEYVALVDLAHNFCRGYFPSDPAATQAVLDRNMALGFQFMGRAAFEAALPAVRTARLADARHMDTEAWCQKTRREITAHGDGAMFTAVPAPQP
jgi:hypothetical protein